jgi:ribonuclease G
VNSGSFVGRGKQARLEDTITRTNLEAAEAVVNELRLRDIGGIIVIDFIDMARARNREAVLKTLRKALDEDRTKTFTAEISKLGLVEMTRQNVTEGVREIMTRTCPTCDGDGVVLSEETVAIEFERRMRELGARAPAKVEAFLVQMNPRVSGQFTGNGARVLQLMEIETGKHFLFTGSEGLPLDHFEVVMEGGLDEIRDEAIPFRDGDEVFVTIVEPHMYEVDDAVAKIDGYIVSVAGGGAHVGEKRLVRIVEAGRTAATAVLVDNGASAQSSAAPEKPAKATRAARPRRKKPEPEPEAPVAEATAVDEPETAEEVEPAPAPRRRTRRKAAEPAGEGAPAAEAEPEEAAQPAGEDESSEDDGVHSKPRRRGRRGGRRRSAAKAESTSAD